MRPAASSIARLLAGVFVLSVVVTACDRTEASEADAGAANDAQPELDLSGPAPHDAPTLEVLRAEHPVTGEADACEDDRDCQPPLRCLEAACVFPVAMTGETGDETPMVIFTGGNREQRYWLETVASPWELTRGLMYRRSMVRDFGMIFLFPDERPRSFWMRNTYLPLDMIFVTEEGVVDSFIERAEPLTDTPRPSDGPARYVIELNAGEIERIGLAPGDRVELLNLPSAP